MGLLFIMCFKLKLCFKLHQCFKLKLTEVTGLSWVLPVPLLGFNCCPTGQCSLKVKYSSTTHHPQLLAQDTPLGKGLGDHCGIVKALITHLSPQRLRDSSSHNMIYLWSDFGT